MNARQQALTAMVDKHKDMILEAERWIWAHPQTGYKEWEANDYLAEKYEALGYTLVRAGNIPGFYTDIDTGKPGPRILVLGELDALYRTLVEKYNALEARVTALEGGESGGGSGTEGGYPDWEPWDGVSLNYQPGAIVKHNGKLWLNVLEGMQNVWEPGVADSRYWTEYIG